MKKILLGLFLLMLVTSFVFHDQVFAALVDNKIDHSYEKTACKDDSCESPRSYKVELSDEVKMHDGISSSSRHGQV